MSESWNKVECLLHKLWGIAHDNPGYKKSEWLDFQAALMAIKEQEIQKAYEQVPKSERRCR